MKKAIFAVIAIVLVSIVSVLGYFMLKTYHRVTDVPADIATRPWSEHQLLENSVIVDFPWPLNTKEAEKSKDIKFKSYQGDGLYVYAGAIESSPDAADNLDVNADRFVEICRKNSEMVESPIKSPISVMGSRAIELQLVMKKKWKPTSQLRCLFFVYNGNFCQIQCNSVTHQPVADAVWKRIKQSIRLRQGVPTQPKAGITQGSSGLPPGMTRRQK